MLKANLSTLLPSITLAEVIPAFERLVGAADAVIVAGMDGSVYYGKVPDSVPCTTVAAVRAGHDPIAQVELYQSPVDARLAEAVQFLALILSHIATETMRRHQLADEVLDRYDELNLIYGLGTSFIQGVPQEEITKTVLDETARIIRADAGVIYVWDASRSNITPVSWFGEHYNPEFWNGRVHELALSALYAYEEAQLFDADKVVCAPLRYNDQLLGSLVLLYDREDRTFKADDVNLLNTLTQNTALFIYAARLVDELTQSNVRLETTLKELQATKEKLSQAERLGIIGQTVSGLFHDLKNPLNIILGYAGLLQESDIGFEDRHQFAGQIIKYVNTISAMTQEILDYVQGDDSVKKTRVEVGDFVDNLRDLLMPPGLERSVQIVINADAARDCVINIDRQRFMRVFQNLVNNAVDAIESAGGSRVEITAEPINDAVRFTVADDGPGVPAQILEHLFDPFVTYGKPHGTGLGLAIVNRMVAIHGGQIQYDPLPGGGARFVFSVPRVSNGQSKF